MYKYWYCPPFNVKHVGWLVDGVRISLKVPVRCLAGDRLTISLDGERPKLVVCLMEVEGNAFCAA